MGNVAKTVSVYTERVINANKRLKEEMNSFGAVRSVILENAKAMKLDSEFKKLLERTKKDAEFYETLKGLVRTTPKGGYRVFYTLQALHKYVNNTAKPEVVEAATSEALNA